MRHVYMDEAGIGNPANEPYTVVAGVMLHVDQQYAALQRYLLAMADDLVAEGWNRPINFAFHAKDLWHGGGYFPRREWSLERRMEILGHLADIPQKFQLPIIYSCVRREEYPPRNPPENSPQRLFRAARATATQKCHTICFISCLTLTERYMQRMYADEGVFAVVELHDDHRGMLLAAAQLLANPRIRAAIENDPDINWPPLTHIVDEPLFVRKSGSSPVQIADVCAFILGRALAGAAHSEPLLDRLRPQLVNGFRREFVRGGARAQPA